MQLLFVSSILICNILMLQSQLLYNLIGGVTDTSFNIKAKGSQNGVLSVFLNGSPQGTYNPDSSLNYDVVVSNLNATTLYNVNLVHNSQNNYVNVTTFPSQNTTVTNMSFIAGSNINTNTNSFIFDRILSKNPRFFMLLGNMHTKADVSADYYTQALSLSATKNLYSQVPLMYLFNDNDFAGSSSMKSSPLVTSINSLYRTTFPTYPLPQTGIYQSFRYGNVLFLMADSRTFLSPETNEFLGSTQVNWIISQLTAAANDPTVGAIFISITQVWNYVKSEYDWDMVKQNFVSILDTASADKKAVGDFVSKNYNFNRPTLPGFKSVMMLVGDTTTAFDDGTWNNFGNFPIAVCGPLDYWQQCRGGPYSHGSFHDNPSNYCQFNVYFNSVTKNTCVMAKGILASTEANLLEQTVWMYDTCDPVTYRGRINRKCPILYTEKLVNAAFTLAAVFVVYVFFFIVIYKMSLKSLSYSS